VWQIVIERACDISNKDKDLYNCAFGYFVSPQYFLPVRTALGYCQDPNQMIVSVGFTYRKYLQRFPTQKVLSEAILEYLQNPRRLFGNLDTRVGSNCVDLTYRGVPVPLLREDFPNKAAIIMALETKVRHVKQTTNRYIYGLIDMELFLEAVRKKAGSIL